MSDPPQRTLELPEDLAEFAQRQIDSGHYGDVIDVVRDAFGLLRERADKVAALRTELDVGLAQLDAGHARRATAREMMNAIRSDIGLPTKS